MGISMYISGPQAPTYSMLIFIKPSLVSVIPCRPVFLTGPSTGVVTCPTLLALSSTLTLGSVVSRSSFDCPHHDPPLSGDWPGTGLLCTLNPGDTARRLIEAISKSSSRRRLLFTFCEISAAVGIFAGRASAIFVSTVGLGIFVFVALPEMPDEGGLLRLDMYGESILTSSDIFEELRGRPGGGGVCILLYMFGQNSF